jgi:hypothetical protein
MTKTFHPSSRRPLLEALTKVAEDFNCRGKISGTPPLPKANPKYGHDETLVIQTMFGDADGAQLNLELGADANYQGKKHSLYRLAQAFDKRYGTNMAKTLIEYGAEPNPSNKKNVKKTTR